MNPDPFSYIIHQICRCGHDKEVELAQELWGEVSYKKAKAILQNHNLNIERKEYYNLTRREETKKLNSQEKLRFHLAYLDQKDFCVCFHEVHTINNQGKYATYQIA